MLRRAIEKDLSGDVTLYILRTVNERGNSPSRGRTFLRCCYCKLVRFSSFRIPYVLVFCEPVILIVHATPNQEKIRKKKRLLAHLSHKKRDEEGRMNNVNDLNVLPDSLFKLIAERYLELKDVASLVQLNQTFLEKLQGYDINCEPTQENLEARSAGLWKWTTSFITDLHFSSFEYGDCHKVIELSAFPKLKSFSGGGMECLEFDDTDGGIRELTELESFSYSSYYFCLDFTDLGYLVHNHSLIEISIDSLYEWDRMFEEFINANIDWTGLKIFHFHENKSEKLTFSIEKLIATFPSTLEKVYYYDDSDADEDDDNENEENEDEDDDNDDEVDNHEEDEGDDEDDESNTEDNKEQKQKSKSKNMKEIFLQASANSKWELL